MNDGKIWYCIAGYNGYEYSQDGLLRSMKNYKKNPYGKLLKKYKDLGGTFYKLSNDKNKVMKVYETEIINIINSNPKITRGTFDTDISSRNILAPTKRQQKKREYIGIPKFTIVKDTTNSINITSEKHPGVYFF